MNTIGTALATYYRAKANFVEHADKPDLDVDDEMRLSAVGAAAQALYRTPATGQSELHDKVTVFMEQELECLDDHQRDFLRFLLHDINHVSRHLVPCTDA